MEKVVGDATFVKSTSTAMYCEKCGKFHGTEDKCQTITTDKDEEQKENNS